MNAALAIKRQGRFEERFLQEHLVWEVGGLVWCEPADHPSFFQSIHSAKKSFFYSSYFSNHHGAKWLMRPTSSKDLPSLLSDSYSMVRPGGGVGTAGMGVLALPPTVQSLHKSLKYISHTVSFNDFFIFFQ